MKPIVVFACAVWTVSLLAAETKLTPSRAFVFKDGYALIVRDGKAVTDANGELHSPTVPESATLGTFWATSTSTDLQAVVAGWKETTATVRVPTVCTSPGDILEANPGVACSLKLTTGETLSGTIAGVLRHDPAAPAGSVGDRRASDISSSRPLPSQLLVSSVVTAGSPTHAVLHTEKGDVFLPVALIQTVTLPEMKTTIERETTTIERAKQLSFHFAGANEERQVSIFSFEPTMRWIPTYRLTIGDHQSRQARVLLQAEILNEADDLQNADVDLVVGVPNFRFRTVASPFSLERELRNLLVQAAPQLMGQQMMRNDFNSNALFAQRNGERGRAEATAAAEVPPELVDGATQDLFVYALDKITLKKGERMARMLYDETVPCAHLYTWDARLTYSDSKEAQAGATASPLRLSENKVWHQVELTNSSRTPWTTGSAFILQDGKPIAQDLLTYTSPGGTTRVPITVAVDIRGELAGREIGREQNKVKWNGYSYARIANEVVLQVTNRKPHAIAIEIAIDLAGAVDEATDEGAVQVQAFRQEDWEGFPSDARINQHSRVAWRLELAAGASFKPTVTYHYFMRD